MSLALAVVLVVVILAVNVRMLQGIYRNRHNFLGGFGADKVMRFREGGDRALLDKGISQLERALAEGQRTGGLDPMVFGALGGSLWQRFMLDGSMQDLQRAVPFLRRSLDLGVADDRSTSLHDLALGLQALFLRTGDVGALDEAIVRGREAVNASTDDADRLGALVQLADALDTRFTRFGDRGDLDDAVSSAARAARLAASGRPRPNVEFTFGTLLMSRFGRTDEPADIRSAIDHLATAVSLTSDRHVNRPAYLQNLSTALLLGSWVLHDGDHATRAVDTAQRTVGATPPGSFNRPFALMTLALALEARFRRNGDSASLDQAIDVGLAAVEEVKGDGPQAAAIHLNLAQDLVTRNRRTESADDLVTAAQLLVRLAGMPVATPLQQLRASLLRARLAIDAGDRGAATEHYEAAIGLLPIAAWRGLQNRDRQFVLAALGEVGPDGAACALAAYDDPTALELLEGGRAVLWTQLLQSRTDLDDLRTTEPELADRLEAVGLRWQEEETRSPMTLPHRG